MAELKFYALTIPLTEMWDWWMVHDPHCDTLKATEVTAVHVDDKTGAVNLLYKDPYTRKMAYEKLHEFYPDTLCAYRVEIAKVDEKHLKGLPK